MMISDPYSKSSTFQFLRVYIYTLYVVYIIWCEYLNYPVEPFVIHLIYTTYGNNLEIYKYRPNKVNEVRPA